jgi:hypothetical protein
MIYIYIYINYRLNIKSILSNRTTLYIYISKRLLKILTCFQSVFLEVTKLLLFYSNFSCGISS